MKRRNQKRSATKRKEAKKLEVTHCLDLRKTYKILLYARVSLASSQYLKNLTQVRKRIKAKEKHLQVRRKQNKIPKANKLRKSCQQSLHLKNKERIEKTRPKRALQMSRMGTIKEVERIPSRTKEERVQLT